MEMQRSFSATIAPHHVTVTWALSWTQHRRHGAPTVQ